MTQSQVIADIVAKVYENPFGAIGGDILQGVLTNMFENIEKRELPALPSVDDSIVSTGDTILESIAKLNANKLQLSTGQVATGLFSLYANASSSMHPVTLQQMNASLVGLWDDRGTYSVSGAGVNYPSTGGSGTAGAILKGDIYTITGGGGSFTGGAVVNNSDTVRALVDSPGNTPSNWAIMEGNLGYTPITNVLNSGMILVGNASNVAAAVTASLSGTAGSFSISNTGVFTFPDADAGQRGFIKSADWVNFNSKLSSTATVAYTNVGTLTVLNALVALDSYIVPKNGGALSSNNVKFDFEFTYGTEGSPEAIDAIPFSLTNAKVGVTCLVIHQRPAGEPVYGLSINKTVSSEPYDGSINNYMLFTYTGGTTILLTIMHKV